ALAERLECPLVAVFRSLDQDRIAQPLVDKRPLGPRCLRNLTALAQGGLHGGVSVVVGGGHADARGRRSAPARPLRTRVHVRGELPLDRALAAAGRAGGSSRGSRRADRRPWSPRPTLGGAGGHERPLLRAAAPGGRCRALSAAD